MADRSSDEAKQIAFNDFTVAVTEYLESIGWRAIVVGPIKVEQQPDAPTAFHYELVVQFTGGQLRRAAADGSTAETVRPDAGRAGASD